jgi:siroheme synthase
MSKILTPEQAKAKDAARMDRKNAGFNDGNNSLITIKQHELLMVAALEAYDRRKNDEIFEYVEYRFSVRGRFMAYRRLCELRVARALRPFAPLIKHYREIQQRKRLRAVQKANPNAVKQ